MALIFQVASEKLAQNICGTAWYVKKIIDAEFDGLYLDIIDTFEP